MSDSKRSAGADEGVTEAPRRSQRVVLGAPGVHLDAIDRREPCDLLDGEVAALRLQFGGDEAWAPDHDEVGAAHAVAGDGRPPAGRSPGRAEMRDPPAVEVGEVDDAHESWGVAGEEGLEPSIS